MKIKKMYQGSAPQNKILNVYSVSQTDTYSCRFLLDYCHPVGEVFETTDSSFNPNVSWGGTWERLTGDAYLKIVNSSAGNYSGTSNQHIIPVTSLPSHSHSGIYEYYSKKEISNRGDGGGGGHNINISSVSSSQNGSYSYLYTGSAGSGQAYYPYYYGVYAWHRTA